MSSTDQPWPWRMLVSGVFEDAWMTAIGDERQQAYVKLIALHREWQSRGARMLCTMDDLGSAGRPGTERANFYEVWETPITGARPRPPRRRLVEQERRPAHCAFLPAHLDREANHQCQRDLGGPPARDNRPDRGRDATHPADQLIDGRTTLP